MSIHTIKKIVSGGQTGVDRAALDAAIALNIPHGGWCPLGRKAEDGAISAIYHLQETPSAEYEERTVWNARDSDGTLIIFSGQLEGSTFLTVETLKKLKKPYLIVDLSTNPKATAIHSWLKENNIHILNVAGPRASKHPEIYDLAYDLIYEILSHFL